MDEDDVRGPDQPEPHGKTEQQLFDEQIARASGKTVVIFGGPGILAALVMSTVALVISAGKSTTTVRVAATPAAGQTAGTGQTGRSGQAPQLTGDALGAQLFVSGKPDTGAIGCGSCHTMKAEGDQRNDRPQPRQGTDVPIQPLPRASRSSTPTRRSSPATART